MTHFMPRSLLLVALAASIFGCGGEIEEGALEESASALAIPFSVHGKNFAANPTGTSLSFVSPAGVAEGDVLIAAVAARGNPTLTAPAGWTLIRTDVSKNVLTQASWFRVATAAEPATHVWRFSTAVAAVGGIVAYAGVDTATPILAQAGQANPASASITAPSVTATRAGSGLVAFFSTVPDATIAPPSQMIELGEAASNTGTYKLVIEGADEGFAVAGSTGIRVARSSSSRVSIGQLIALKAKPPVVPPMADAGLPPIADAGATGADAGLPPATDAGTSAADAGVAAPVDGGAVMPAPGGSTYLTVSRASLMALPTSGSAFEFMRSVADGSLGTVDLANQDSQTAAKTVAAALMYARTGNATYRNKVAAVLQTIPGAPTDAGRVLSVGRQVAGFVIAADLVDYRTSEFVAWAQEVRTRYIPNHSRWISIKQCSENSASNWGAWAISSRIAASVFVGDRADVARAAAVFRAALGERSLYGTSPYGDPAAGYRYFQKTAEFDPTWSHDPSQWLAINPLSAGLRGGAIVEDIARSVGSYPTVDATGLMYSWETLGGFSMAALLLAHAGYPDIWSASDRALLRAAQFLHANGGYPPAYRSSNHTAWMINKVYGVALGPVGPAYHHREYGFTDWLPAW